MVFFLLALPTGFPPGMPPAGPGYGGTLSWYRGLGIIACDPLSVFTGYQAPAQNYGGAPVQGYGQPPTSGLYFVLFL